jgi:hypothetical protein
MMISATTAVCRQGGLHTREFLNAAQINGKNMKNH